MVGWKIKIKRDGIKLVEAVKEVLGSKKKAKKAIDEGLISVNNRKTLDYRLILKKGSKVIVPNSPLLFSKSKVKTIYEDETILIVNKPPFLKSNLDKPNVEELLRKKLKNPNLFVAHRLDKQTSGCLIVAKSREIFEALKRFFLTKRIEKEYIALISGVLPFKKKKINSKVEGKEAVSYLSLEEVIENCSLVKVKIETGRKHQIRIHLSRIHHPVVGEFLYWKNWKEPLSFSPRIMLHAYKLKFENPVTKKRVEVSAPIPGDMKSFLSCLKSKNFNFEEVEI